MGTGQVLKLHTRAPTGRTGEMADTENLLAGKGEALLAEADAAGLALVARGSAGHSPTCQTCQQLQLQPVPDLHVETLHLLQHL